MSDSRVEKLTKRWYDRVEPSIRPAWSNFQAVAQKSVDGMEASGLLVIDPDDPEVEKRIARVLDPHYEDLSAFDQRGIANRARAVISALRQR